MSHPSSGKSLMVKESGSRGQRNGSSSLGIQAAGGVSKKKPQRVAQPYEMFVKYSRAVRKEKGRIVKDDGFLKKCADLWKNMTLEERQPFHDLTVNDKKRFDQELKDYGSSSADEEIKRRRKYKGHNAPNKRPFLWFCQELEPVVELENPEMNEHGILMELGRLWYLLGSGQKARYEDMYEHDKFRFQLEKEAFESIVLIFAGVDDSDF